MAAADAKVNVFLKSESLLGKKKRAQTAQKEVQSLTQAVLIHLLNIFHLQEHQRLKQIRSNNRLRRLKHIKALKKF